MIPRNGMPYQIRLRSQDVQFYVYRKLRERLSIYLTLETFVPKDSLNLNSSHQLELLEEFYEKQNGRPMAEAQRDFARDLMERIWEGEA